MKKKIDICYHCEQSKYDNSLVLCDYDLFNIQRDVSENIVEFEYIPPPKNCPNRLEHIVISQDLQ